MKYVICGSMKNYNRMLDVCDNLMLFEDNPTIFLPIPKGERSINVDKLKKCHMNKIKLSDCIVVVGFPGLDTHKEIDYAKSLNKCIVYVE